MYPEPRPLKDLTAFQRDVLTVLGKLQAPNGLEAKAELEADYGVEEIRNSRWYQNLSQLVARGLVEKEEVSRTENSYTLTAEGREALEADLEYRVRAIGD